MARSITYYVVCGFFLSAAPAAAQPIIKSDAAALPAGALAQLGRLAGFRYDGQPATATLSADGKLLAAADMQGAITIVNTQTGKIAQTFRGNIFAASNGSMTFSADNSTLAIQTFADLTVWDVAGGKQLLKVQTRGGTGARHLGPSLSADGKIVGASLDRIGKGKNGEVKAIEVATAKVIATFESLHNFNIRTAIAPDGKTMLSWGQVVGGGVNREANSTIQVWDLAKGNELRKIKLNAAIQCAAYTPDGNTIAAAVSPNIQLIDFETGKETRVITGERNIGSVALRFSPDGGRLVAYDVNGGLQAWEVADGKRIALVNAPKTQLLAVAFPAKDRVVAMGFLAQTLTWWDAADAKATRFEGHLAPIAALAFAGDGKTLISASHDQRLIWWDTATGNQTRQLTIAADERIGGISRPATIALAPDGKRAATYSSFGVRGVKLFDLKDGRPLREFNVAHGFGQVDLKFSAGSSKLSAAGMMMAASAWDVDSGQSVYTSPPVKGPGGQLDSRAAVSPDGKVLAMHQFDPFGDPQRQAINEIILWDLADKKELRRIKLPAGNPGANDIVGMTFSADGKFLAVPDFQGAVQLYSTASGREWRKLTPAARAGSVQIAFSPDGRLLAVGISPYINFGPGARADDDVSIEIWEIASGQKRAHFKGHAAAITCLAFSRDDAILASGSMDTTVLLWDVAGKNTKLAPFAENEIAAAWKTLTGDDANVSATMRRLIRSPATVGFLEQNFPPAKKMEIDDKKVAKMVADLDAADFTVRDVATRDLKLLGARAEAALKKGLADTPSAEARRRIQDLLDAMVRIDVTPEELQAIRGVEILERICTPEALDLLIALSKGDPLARATQEAEAALKRMPLK